MGVLRQLLGTAGAVHAAASLYGVTRSLGVIPETAAMIDGRDDGSDSGSSKSKGRKRMRTYASLGVSREKRGRLDPLIENMYSGRGADDTALGALLLSEDVVFEDPVARVVGRDEVVEAFRALQFFNPENVGYDKGRCSDPKTRDYDISQKYSPSIFGGTFTFELRSRVMITLDERGRVARIEERWNHIPLVDNLKLFRRINGIVCYYATNFFIK